MFWVVVGYHRVSTHRAPLVRASSVHMVDGEHIPIGQAATRTTITAQALNQCFTCSPSPYCRPTGPSATPFHRIFPPIAVEAKHLTTPFSLLPSGGSSDESWVDAHPFRFVLSPRLHACGQTSGLPCHLCHIRRNTTRRDGRRFCLYTSEATSCCKLVCFASAEHWMIQPGGESLGQPMTRIRSDSNI